MSAGPQPLDALACPLDGISLIEASAGTGKTWNICNLYLRLLLERDLEVQQILVVTFTNAATAELRERVRARLVQARAHLSDPTAAAEAMIVDLLDAVARTTGQSAEQLAHRLEAALACFDEAAIYTIHGFCQRALADTPLAAGLPYGVELIEDDGDLRHEAVADYWRREVAGAQADPDLAGWLAARGESPEEWAALLKRVESKPLSKAQWPDALDAPAEALRPRLDAAFDAARTLWTSQRANAIATLHGGQPSVHAGVYKPEAIEAGAVEWDAWCASANPLWPDYRVEGKARLYSAAHLAAKAKKGKTAPRHAFFDAAAELVEARNAAEAQLERLRLRLVRDMLAQAGRQLRDRKRARRVVSFDDILHDAWDALCRGERPRLASALRKRYPVALIDEFQDTDPLQCAIFMAIYGTPGEAGVPGPLFLVGDPKQAIYSFRNADLPTYLQAKRRAGRQHTLGDNQRSVGGLIEALNALFTANPGGFILPGIEYQPVRLGSKPRAPFTDGTEPLDAPLRLWRLPADAAGEYLLRNEALAFAAQATAAEISRLLRAAREKRIALGERELLARDVAVLVRSHRQGARMREALAEVGIGSVELSQESIFASRDAEDLEQIVAAILEPGHQARLLAALATEHMGCDARAIESLARDDAGLAQRTTRFDDLRKTWLARGFGFMFREWLDGDGVSRRLLARADGERRLTNLLHLGELLHRAAQAHPAPDALARWFATQRTEAASGEEAQLRLESDRNLVQIVTIHKAKGLEYGIVFCPFLWDGTPRPRNDSRAIEYHGDDGHAIIDFRPEAAQDDVISGRRRLESAAEDARLMYVALTRAVHRCYVVAGCYRQKSGSGAPTTKQSTRSLLNWLAAGAGSTYDDWLEQDRPPAAIEEAWRRIADVAKPHIRVADLPRARGERMAPPGERPEDLAALAAPTHIDPGWRMGSYSGLASGAEHETAAIDHDARAAVRAPAAVPDDLPAHDILRFPRGASAGDCVHALFEHADFTSPANWDASIQRALALHPQRGLGNAPPALQSAMLRALLENVLAAPLPEGIVLGRVPGTRRLDELGFSLPAAALQPAALNAWLKAHGYPMPRLSFAALQGYLRGYIDLVFEHGGRYYVLDWKSNHLGYAPEDYAGERVGEAMEAHGYHLQHLLYAVAVHRYLRRRIADYDYERHFGGALYLFVRGVRPQWRSPTGDALGVWFHRPPAATLASLEALLAGQPKAQAA